MTEYGKKLIELRQQMERKIYLDSLLAQLNEEKATLEYEIQPLADTLNKAVKKADKAQRGGIFALFNKNDDTAYTELSAARTAYNDAMGQLDSLKHRIQKTFNEAASLSDAKRLYTNLMDEIDKALAQGKTDIITQAELDEEYTALQKSRKEKLAKAIDVGTSLLDYLEYVMDGNLPHTRPQDIKKELYKFRLAVNDVDISNNIAIDFTSYRHFYSKVGYPGSYLNNIDGHLPVVRYDFPLTPKEMLAEVELTAQNVTQTVEMLKQQLEQLT